MAAPENFSFSQVPQLKTNIVVFSDTVEYAVRPNDHGGAPTKSGTCEIQVLLAQVAPGPGVQPSHQASSSAALSDSVETRVLLLNEQGSAFFTSTIPYPITSNKCDTSSFFHNRTIILSASSEFGKLGPVTATASAAAISAPKKQDNDDEEDDGSSGGGRVVSSVAVSFPTRAAGINFCMALASSIFRSCRAKIPTLLVLNELECTARKNGAAVLSAVASNSDRYEVKGQVVQVVAMDTTTMDVIAAESFVSSPKKFTSEPFLGLGQLSATAAGDPLTMTLASSREGINFVAAFILAYLPPWLLPAVAEVTRSLARNTVILCCSITIDSIVPATPSLHFLPRNNGGGTTEGGVNPAAEQQKEALKKRLQKQGGSSTMLVSSFGDEAAHNLVGQPPPPSSSTAAVSSKEQKPNEASSLKPTTTAKPNAVVLPVSPPVVLSTTNTQAAAASTPVVEGQPGGAADDEQVVAVRKQKKKKGGTTATVDGEGDCAPVPSVASSSLIVGVISGSEVAALGGGGPTFAEPQPLDTQMAAGGDDPGKVSKQSKKKKTATDGTSKKAVVDADRVGSPLPDEYQPPVAVSGDSAAAQLTMEEYALKLEKKKLRLLKFEAELLQQDEAVSAERRRVEEFEKSLQTNRIRLEDEYRQFEQQKDLFKQTQLTFYQQNYASSSDDTAGRNRGKGAMGAATSSSSIAMRGGTPNQQQRLSGSPQAKSVNSGEKNPLLGGGGGGATARTEYDALHAPFIFRLEQNYYDTSKIPFALWEAYPLTCMVLGLMTQLPGLLMFLAINLGGVALGIAALIVTPEKDMSLWPIPTLCILVMICLVLFYRQRFRIVETLHMMDQSCSLFEDTVFIYTQKWRFTIYPCLVLVLTLSPLLFLFFLMRSSRNSDGPFSGLGLCALICGCSGASATLSGLLLLIHLSTDICRCRVAKTISTTPGALCTRLQLRSSVARYQHLKTTTSLCAGAWSLPVATIIVIFLSMMLYGLYDAIMTVNALPGTCIFFGSSLCLWCLFYSICGFHRSTSSILSVITNHLDRWGRGDYNADSDVRFDDFVVLQQFFYFCIEGGNYAKWAISFPMFSETDGASASVDYQSGGAFSIVIGPLWMFVDGFLVLASAVMIPLVLQFHIHRDPS